MTRLLAPILLMMLAACGGSKSSTANTTATRDPSVDPTVPSWLPESCMAYHKAVVQAIDCQAVDQGKRDQIQKTFDVTSARWKAEDNADKATVDSIGATCTTETASVRVDIGDRCV